MKKDYWPEFWKKHGRKSADADEHVQVLRTKNKAPIEKDKWRRTTQYILDQLALEENDDALDLCCGNGLITTEIAGLCRSVTCVDVAPELVDKIDTEKYPNITPRVGDVREIRLEPASVDKVLIYAAIQYLDLSEAIEWFLRMHDVLREGGMMLVGDIPDRAKLWTFFNSDEREAVHFESMLKGEAIVGTWFEQDWLLKLAKYAGFSHAEIIPQPDYMIYAEYRYDMKVIK
jgi:cyclopropane fatty-acyl-phospholipid synthase-like methyltransferase